MTTDLESLAQRAVACPRWRWFPGMRWVTDDDSGRCDDHQPESMTPPAGALPDFSDTATVCCLLPLVREARGDRRLVAVPMSGGRWGVAISTVMREGPRHCDSTEAAALVAALEAAPTVQESRTVQEAR